MSVATVYAGHSGIIPTWFEGSSLSDRVCLAGELSRDELAVVASDLLGALALAHEGGLLHGALHPDHVFLAGANGTITRAIVRGFGAPLEPRDADIGFHEGAFVAPERLAHGPTVGSDLHAAASILYFAATGAAPYTAPRALDAPLFGSAARLPRPLFGVLVHAMSADPARRYRSADELRNAVLAALEASRRYLKQPRMHLP